MAARFSCFPCRLPAFGPVFCCPPAVLLSFALPAYRPVSRCPPAVLFSLALPAYRPVSRCSPSVRLALSSACLPPRPEFCVDI